MNEVDAKNKIERQKMQDKRLKIIAVTKLTQRKVISQKNRKTNNFQNYKNIFGSA